MKITKSTKLADRVLPLVASRIRGLKIEGEAIVDLYLNGRESGYAVCLYVPGSEGTPCVAFSENRNSDDLVVYPWNTRHLYGSAYPASRHTGSHGLSDHAYGHRQYFRVSEPDGAERAADFIVENLIEQSKQTADDRV